MTRSYNPINGEGMFPNFTVRISSDAPFDGEPEIVINVEMFTDEQLKRIRVVDGLGDTYQLNLPF